MGVEPCFLHVVAFISCEDLKVSVSPNVLLSSIFIDRKAVEQLLENLNVLPKIPKWVTEPRVLTHQLEIEQPVFVPTPGSLWLRLLFVLIVLLGVAVFWSMLSDPFLSSRNLVWWNPIVFCGDGLVSSWKGAPVPYTGLSALGVVPVDWASTCLSSCRRG